MFGTVSFNTGDFSKLRRQPADPNIHNERDARDHVRRVHLSYAIDAAKSAMRKVQKQQFASQKDCDAAWATAAPKAEKAFLNGIKASQELEKQGWRR